MESAHPPVSLSFLYLPPDQEYLYAILWFSLSKSLLETAFFDSHDPFPFHLQTRSQNGSNSTKPMKAILLCPQADGRVVQNLNYSAHVVLQVAKYNLTRLYAVHTYTVFRSPRLYAHTSDHT